MHATLVFLLTSLRGVDSDTKRSLANSKEFCENLIIASVSSPIEDDDDIVDDDNDDNNDDDDNNIIMITVNIIKILLPRLDAPSLHAFLKRIISSLR
jgi:transcriptional regulator of met regulon